MNSSTANTKILDRQCLVVYKAYHINQAQTEYKRF